MLLVVAAALPACAEKPHDSEPARTPAVDGGAPNVSVGGTMRNFYGYTR